MYKHILVPTDGSKLSARAAKAAIGIARATGAKLTAFHVVTPYMPPAGDAMMYYVDGFSPEDYDKATAAQAERALGQVKKAALAADVPCATLSETAPQPWAAIIATARSKRCDLIVMASHGRRGLAGLILGSETAKVLTHSKTPVLVCR
jgi:nucleotide-binding universal stress UspA family protein